MTAASVDGDVSGIHVDIVSGGSNPWDVILGQSSVEIELGETYTVSFQAQATEALTIALRWQQGIAAADVYTAALKGEEGRMPFDGECDGRYPWGANSHAWHMPRSPD
jgi:hypothetical protein